MEVDLIIFNYLILLLYNAVLLLWTLFVICISHLSLFFAALWSPAGNGLASCLLCMIFFLCFSSLSDMVSLVRCGACV